MDLEIKPVDKAFYEKHLGYLPARMIDIHTHVLLRAHRQRSPVERRGPTWPGSVAAQNLIADLLATYRLMFPQQVVTPVIFGPATQEYDLDASNQYVSQAATQHGLPSFLVTTPEWTAQELEARVVRGGFLGLKPYLEWAPSHIPSDDITIFDFLPAGTSGCGRCARLDRHAAHPAPRPARDPLNLEMMLEIEHRYPNVQLVIAHIGRAYCPEDVGNAFEVLRTRGHALRLLRQHERLCDGTTAAGGRPAARGVRQ